MMGLTWVLGSAVIVGEWRRRQAPGERSAGRAGDNGGLAPRRLPGVVLSWLGPLGLCLGVSLLIRWCLR